MDYTFEMTAAFAREAAGALGRALQVHNERIYRRACERMPWRPRLRVAGVLVSVGGVALAWVGWAGARRSGDLFVAYAAVCSAFALVFAAAPRFEPKLRSLTRRMIGWRARKMMVPVARRAPYSIRYALSGSSLSARVEKLKLSLDLDLRAVAFAVAAPDFVCAFPKPFSARRLRVLYVPGAPERGALIEALRSCGAQVEELSP